MFFYYTLFALLYCWFFLIYRWSFDKRRVGTDRPAHRDAGKVPRAAASGRFRIKTDQARLVKTSHTLALDSAHTRRFGSPLFSIVQQNPQSE
jgi:hypothetical protein